MTELREVNSCTHQWSRNFNCRRCGIYNYKNEAVKTSKYCTPFHFNLKHYLSSLRKSACKTVEPRQIGDQTYLLLSCLCDKFVFTRETLSLGLYIYQVNQKLVSNEKFWAATALIVAGKAMELDKYVPYLDRYQRYAEKSFTQQEYEQAERTLFEAMNFQMQYSTFLTFLDFYLTCGVLFKEDSINSSLVQYFQDDVTVRARQWLKRGAFTRHQPELLALAIIKEIRIKYNLKGWNEHLEQLAGYCDQQIAVIAQPRNSPLKQVSQNLQQKLGELKVTSTRRNIQNVLQNDRVPPLLEKYATISKPLQKQNVHSTLKVPLQVLRKPSHSYLQVEGLNVLALDMLNKRK